MKPISPSVFTIAMLFAVVAMVSVGCSQQNENVAGETLSDAESESTTDPPETSEVNSPADSVSDPAAAIQAAAGDQLAEMGGRLHAAAELCGTHSPEELAEMKAQQRDTHDESNFDVDTFDEAFAGGERALKEEWSAMSEAEQSAACEELRQMSEMDVSQLPTPNEMPQ